MKSGGVERLSRRERFRLRAGLIVLFPATAVLLVFPLLLGPDAFKGITPREAASLVAERLTVLAGALAHHAEEIAGAAAPVEDFPEQFNTLEAYLQSEFPEFAGWDGGVQVVAGDGTPLSWAGDLTGCCPQRLKRKESDSEHSAAGLSKAVSKTPRVTVEKHGDILWLTGRAAAGLDHTVELFVPLERPVPFRNERRNQLITPTGLSGVDVELREGSLEPGPDGAFTVSVPRRIPPEGTGGSLETRDDSDPRGDSSENRVIPFISNSDPDGRGDIVNLIQPDGSPAGEVRCLDAGLIRSGGLRLTGRAACWFATVVFTAAFIFAAPGGRPLAGLILVTAGQIILRTILLLVPGLTGLMFGEVQSGPEHYASVAGFGLLRSPADLFLTALQLSIVGVWWLRFARGGRSGVAAGRSGPGVLLRYSPLFILSAFAAWVFAPGILFSIPSSAPGVFPPFRGVFFGAPEILLSAAAVILTAVTVLFTGTISRLAASCGWRKRGIAAAILIPVAGGWFTAPSTIENGTAAVLYFLLLTVFGVFLAEGPSAKRGSVPISRLIFFPVISAVSILFAQYGMQGGEGGWRSAVKAANEGEQVWIRMLVEETLEDFARFGAEGIIGSGISADKEDSPPISLDAWGAGNRSAYRAWLRTGLAAEGIPSAVELYSETGEALAHFSAGFPSWFRLGALDLLEKVGATGELVILRGWEHHPGNGDMEVPFYTGRLRLRADEGENLQVIVTALGPQSAGGVFVPPGAAVFDAAPGGEDDGTRWRITFLLGILGLATALMLLAAPVFLRDAGSPGRWRSVFDSFRFRLLVAMVVLSLLPILFWGAFAVQYRTGNLREQHEERIRRGMEQLTGVLESGRLKFDGRLPESREKAEESGGMQAIEPDRMQFRAAGFCTDGSGLGLIMIGDSKQSGSVELSLDGRFCRDMAAVLTGDVRIYTGKDISADNRPEYLLAGLRQGRMDGSVYRKFMYEGEVSVIAEESLGGITHLTGYRALEDEEGKYVGAIAVTLQAFEEKAAVERSLFTASIAGLAALWVLLTMTGSLVLSARISVSIARVTRVTEQLARGWFGRIGAVSSLDEVKRLVSSFNIMSDRLKKNRDLLERNRNFLSSTLDSLDAAVLAADSGGRVVFVNRKMRRELLKQEDPEDRGEEDGVPVPDEERGLSASVLLSTAGYAEQAGMLESVLTGESNSLQRETSPPGGKGGGTWRMTAHRLESSQGGLLGVVLVIEDLSDVIRSKKLVAWGEMARQVAHEIKNPLTPMKLQAQHISHAWRDGADGFDEILHESLEVIIEQIERLRRIATEFSWFAGRPDRVPVEVRVDGIVKNCLSDYGHLESRGIQVRTSLPQDLPPVRMAEEELRRVIVNLVENALQAMGESGVLSISLRSDPEGGQELSINDTGTGISDDAKDRLFEPYFSTKSQGTGLGLPIVQSILERYGADITVTAAEGRGTTALVRFPLSIEVGRIEPVTNDPHP